MKKYLLPLFACFMLVFSACESEVSEANTDEELLKMINRDGQRLLDLRNEVVMRLNDRNREMLIEVFHGTKYEAEAPQIVEYILQTNEANNAFTNDLLHMYNEVHRMMMENKPTGEISEVWNEQQQSIRKNLQKMREDKENERQELRRLIDEKRMPGDKGPQPKR